MPARMHLACKRSMARCSAQGMRWPCWSIWSSCFAAAASLHALRACALRALHDAVPPRCWLRPLTMLAACAGATQSLIIRLLKLVDDVLLIAQPPLCHASAGFSGTSGSLAVGAVPVQRLQKQRRQSGQRAWPGRDWRVLARAPELSMSVHAEGGADDASDSDADDAPELATASDEHLATRYARVLLASMCYASRCLVLHARNLGQHTPASLHSMHCGLLHAARPCTGSCVCRVQVVSTACWLTVKEAALLLGTLVQTAPLTGVTSHSVFAGSTASAQGLFILVCGLMLS